MYSSTSGPCNSVGKNRLEPARQKLRKFSVGELEMFSKVLKRLLVRVFFSVAKMNQQRTHHVLKSGIGTNSLRTVQLNRMIVAAYSTRGDSQMEVFIDLLPPSSVVCKSRHQSNLRKAALVG
jgi:hypothetical protein